MSLFIGGLAFPDEATVDAVKIGVLIGSIVSALGGFLVLRFADQASGVMRGFFDPRQLAPCAGEASCTMAASSPYAETPARAAGDRGRAWRRSSGPPITARRRSSRCMTPAMSIS